MNFANIRFDFKRSAKVLFFFHIINRYGTKNVVTSKNLQNRAFPKAANKSQRTKNQQIMIFYKKKLLLLHARQTNARRCVITRDGVGTHFAANE